MSENLDLNINIETKGTEVIGLFRKELKEANGELLKAQTLYGDYSAEAVKAAQKVALLKDKIQEARETSDLFDPGKKFQALTGSLTAVAGGFGAIQGAMALFGVESDNVQKALLKVNAAMALSQGLSTIKDSAKDFERLGSMIKLTTFYQQANNAVNVIATTIMRALGISVNTTSVAFTRLKIAIAATGIGLLIAGISLAVTAFENFAGAAEKAEEAQKKLNKQIQDGAKVQLEGEIESLNRQEKLDIAKAKLRGATEEEIFKIEQGYRNDKIKAQQRYVNEIANIDAKAAADTENAIENAANDAEVARLTEQKRIQDNKIQNAIETIEFQTQKEYEGEIKKYEILKELREKLGRQEVIDYKELAKLRNDQKEADEKDIDDRVTNIMSKGLAARTERTLSSMDTYTATDKKNKEDLLNAQEQFENAKLDVLSNGLQLIGNLAGQGTKVAKAAALADIAIGTGVGFVNALDIAQKSAKGTGPAAAFAFPIFYATQIAAVLGAASRAKSVLSSGNTISSSISAPSMSSSAPTMPQQLPRATTTSLSQETINDIGNQAVRAYVVESDVTSSQERITAIRQRARFS
jgi:hypothetical protein